MTEEEKLFYEVGNSLHGSEKSQMFGKQCFKTGGKAFACFSDQSMVFKLTGNFHKEAIDLDGAELFDPSGKGRPMKEWVKVPYAHNDQWYSFAKAAIDYVGTLLNNSN